jgi:type II secretory pathway pseudopilin PulG
MRSIGVRGQRRRGTTIVELMLALVLLGVGTASLAGGMRHAARASAHGRSFAAGARAAESRLEQLRSRCGAGAGAASSGPVSERWHVGPPAGPLLNSVEAEDSVTLALSARSARRVIRSIVRCVP